MGRHPRLVCTILGGTDSSECEILGARSAIAILSEISDRDTVVSLYSVSGVHSEPFSGVHPYTPRAMQPVRPRQNRVWRMAAIVQMLPVPHAGMFLLFSLGASWVA